MAVVWFRCPVCRMKLRMTAWAWGFICPRCLARFQVKPGGELSRLRPPPKEKVSRLLDRSRN
jgi:hypothetical protein